MKSYLRFMIRSAPPAPIKTALLTFVIALGLALLVTPH